MLAFANALFRFAHTLCPTGAHKLWPIANIICSCWHETKKP